jgi:hypothetical protein
LISCSQSAPIGGALAGDGRQAATSQGKCLLEVNGRAYIKGPCNIEVHFRKFALASLISSTSYANRAPLMLDIA